MDAYLTSATDTTHGDAAVPAAPLAALPGVAPVARVASAPLALVVLGVIGFLYFLRPVVLPVLLACMAAMTLKPLVRWLSSWHVPAAVSAAVVLVALMVAVGAGFFQLGRPALAWLNDAPQHMIELRQRVQRVFPHLGQLGEAAAAVTDLGATEAEKRADQRKAPTVELKTGQGASSILNWTGTLLVGVVETLVLLYLLLASGDMFLQKFVHVMPTLRDKRRAVEISREIQQNFSRYLFSVSLINLCLGIAVSAGLTFMDVPNAVMWGMLVAGLNFVPYFGPVLGVLLLAAVGLLTFDTLGHGLLPPAWYLLLHLLEANFVTPVLLGRRFTLNPVAIFISLIFWTWLWGVPGALLSVPILVSVKVVCDHVPALSSYSELLAT